MNMDASPVFLDTNILIYANVAESPLHKTAFNAIRHLEATGCALWISRQVLREYLATLTRSGLFTDPPPVATLIARVRFFQNRFHVADEGSHVTDKLLDLLDEIPCGGKQVHDANIVASMQAYSIDRLITHNTTDFDRFANLITILPLVEGSTSDVSSEIENPPPT